MPPRFAKLAALGAFGACAGLLAIYLGLVYITRPSPTHGIDMTNSVVAWIGLGGVFAALIATHVVIARQLLMAAKGIKYPV